MVSKQNSLLSWREKLGLTQQALADYLAIGRSLLNMVERGERELPVQAFGQFTQLISHYEAATVNRLSPEYTPPERQQRLELLNKLAKDMAWKLVKLQ